MFQPAGVRTLLHMRSSVPSRPATGRVRRLRTAEPGSTGVRRPGTGSPTGCKSTFRPLTAPATSGAGASADVAFLATQVGHVVEEEGGEEEEEEEEDFRDPETLIARASTDIYQLQHNWMHERQAEAGRLWEQLEQEYGTSLPGNNPAARLEAFRSAASGAGNIEAIIDTFLPPSAEAAAGSSSSTAEEESNAEADVEHTIGGAKSDLETAQSFRRQLEQRRDVAAPGSSPAAARSVAAAAEEEESGRVDELRREVQLLREGAQHAWCEEGAEPEPPVLEGAPGEMCFALHKWADDLRLLGALGAEAADQSRPGSAAAVQQSAAKCVDAPGAAGDAAAAAMEQQLDDLLGELDEFDRIWSSSLATTSANN